MCTCIQNLINIYLHVHVQQLDKISRHILMLHLQKYLQDVNINFHNFNNHHNFIKKMFEKDIKRVYHVIIKQVVCNIISEILTSTCVS